MKTALLQGALAVGLAALAGAQGADDCSNAQVISGLGPHFFDNTAATKDGPNDCDGSPARKDVWFKWTAPATGGYVYSDCSSASMQTRVVAYDDQACPVTASPIGCSAAGCSGIGTRLSFPTVAGQSYLIRVGSKNFNQSGTGSFTFTFDNCWNLSDDAYEENDTCETARPMDSGSYLGLYVSKVDADWYELDVEDGAQLVVDCWFTHSTGDIDLWLWDACGGTSLASAGSADDNEQLTWDNTTGACARVVLKVEHWAPDVTSECQNYDLDLAGAAPHGTCSGGGLGTAYCDPANSNSTGQPALISASGSAVAADNDVLLSAAQLPASQFGYFVNAQAQGLVQPPGSQGNLCLSGGIGRYNAFVLNSGATGEFSLQLDLTNTPTPGGPVSVQAGESWYFQAWYRDVNPTPTNNFTNGVCILFQ